MLAAADKKPSEVTLRDLCGKKVRLRDYRDKTLVLNFWATWCVPCRHEMPIVVEAEKTWAAKDVTFIATSLDEAETMKDIAAFIERTVSIFPYGPALRRRTSTSFGWERRSGYGVSGRERRRLLARAQ
jgi:thiol-disulfide isomerase/thioredoxin